MTKAITRINDMTLGSGSHGLPCCPHVIVGFHLTGSPTVGANGLAVTRVGDISVHTCPHCGINMNVIGAQTVISNGIGITRVGDPETEFCGCGISVTGSPTVNTR